MDINSLYSEFYSEENRSKENDFFLKLYEHNIDVIEGENENFNKSFVLRADYALIHVEDENYYKALPLLNYCIEIINNNSELLDKVNTIDFLKRLRFNQAICNYYTKRVARSAVEFKKLYEEYPDNVIYRNWYISSITYGYNQVINILWGVAFITVFLYYVAKYFNYITIGDVSLLIGIISLIIVGAINVLKYFKKLRVKS